MDLKFRSNHRCNALVHKGPGGRFIGPQIDSAGGSAVAGTQEMFPHQPGHVTEPWGGLVKRIPNLFGRKASRELEAGNYSNQFVHDTIDTQQMAFGKWDERGRAIH
jgi:hypothetical protein